MITVWLLMQLDFTKGFWRDKKFYYFLLALSFSFHIRTTGIALVAGVLFYLLLEKHWKAIGAVLGGFAVLTMPWILRGKILGLSSSYSKQLFKVNPYQLELGDAGLMDFAARFGDNFLRYVSKEIPIALFTFLDINYKLDAPPSAYINGGCLILLGLWGVYILPKYRSLIIGYLGGSFFILLLWPKVWYGARFVLPLIPIMIFLVVSSASWILEHLFSLVR
jgi:hypothetical protein